MYSCYLLPHTLHFYIFYKDSEISLNNLIFDEKSLIISRNWNTFSSMSTNKFRILYDILLELF